MLAELHFTHYIAYHSVIPWWVMVISALMLVLVVWVIVRRPH